PQGNQQQDPMDKFMHNTFWLEDRISVAFVVANPPNGAFPDDAAINEELHRKVQDLSKNIEDLGFTLNFFSESVQQKPLDAEQLSQPNPSQSDAAGDVQARDDTNSFPPGVYLFRP